MLPTGRRRECGWRRRCRHRRRTRPGCGPAWWATPAHAPDALREVRPPATRIERASPLSFSPDAKEKRAHGRRQAGWLLLVGDRIAQGADALNFHFDGVA